MPTSLALTGTQETTVASSTAKVALTIKIGHNQCLAFTFYIVDKVICNLPIITPKGGFKTEVDKSKLADSTWATPGKIDALFGVQIWIKIVEPRIIKSLDGTSIAQSTQLGYVIFQNPPHHSKKAMICTTRSGPALAADRLLTETLEKFWNV